MTTAQTVIFSGSGFTEMGPFGRNVSQETGIMFS